MKPYAVYGRKPRASKTSKRVVLNGIPLFLHKSKAGTGDNIVVYYDRPPYPRIVVVAAWEDWQLEDKLKEFFSKNATKIKVKLTNLDKNLGFSKEMFDEFKKEKKEVKDEYSFRDVVKVQD